MEDRLDTLAFEPPPAPWHALEGERDRLRLLLEVSESIASHRDVTALFHDLAQRLPRVVPFDVINLVLYDPERDVMRLHALVAPESNATTPGLEFPMSSLPTNATACVCCSGGRAAHRGVIRDRWKPSILFELKTGTKRFCGGPVGDRMLRHSSEPCLVDAAV
jgi:hypothetical protein